MARRAAKAKTVAQQSFLLGRLPITATSAVRAGRLRWEGHFQPTSCSERYLVRIDYAPPTRPEIVVVSPRIEAPDEGELPHVYPGDRLCLCFPDEWKPQMRIDTTIVPWIAEWLLQYELFSFTTRWHGGGHRPARPPVNSVGGENASMAA
jgi:hypothetical protein